jgi:ergothioneine biosynthesis protein EgtB
MQQSREQLLERFLGVQGTFEHLCQPLTAEEHRVQPIVEASPPWWSIMHTSWFYARNILREMGAYQDEDRMYDVLLNSYYHALGTYLEQGMRGRLSEPSNERAYAYRASVQGRMTRLISETDEVNLPKLAGLLEIGVNHEEQHIELLLTEIKRIKGEIPVARLRRPYAAFVGTGASDPSVSEQRATKHPGESVFLPFPGGDALFGNVEGGWCWDNELGVHRNHINAFALMDRTVTNGEYLEFMEDGGYRDCGLWLSSAYDLFLKKGLLHCPLYWEKIDGSWWNWTLSGMQRVDPWEPVCHVNFYEAHAYAAWKARSDARYRQARLPTEHEWEYAARLSGVAFEGNLLEKGRYHPEVARECGPGLPRQMFGDLWEWTSSHYEPYPGYRAFPGGLCEYNSKFMNNQRVLRGGSCATPTQHLRISYRNFWAPATQFQFTGMRLARDLD